MLFILPRTSHHRLFGFSPPDSVSGRQSSEPNPFRPPSVQPGDLVHRHTSPTSKALISRSRSPMLAAWNSSGRSIMEMAIRRAAQMLADICWWLQRWLRLCWFRAVRKLLTASLQEQNRRWVLSESTERQNHLTPPAAQKGRGSKNKCCRIICRSSFTFIHEWNRVIKSCVFSTTDFDHQRQQSSTHWSSGRNNLINPEIKTNSSGEVNPRFIFSLDSWNVFSWIEMKELNYQEIAVIRPLRVILYIL